MDYWLETVEIACDEANISVTKEQLKMLAEQIQAAHEMFSESHGHHNIPDPQAMEIKKLERELENERENSVLLCPRCKGARYITTTDGAPYKCHVCSGRGVK